MSAGVHCGEEWLLWLRGADVSRGPAVHQYCAEALRQLPFGSGGKVHRGAGGAFSPVTQ